MRLAELRSFDELNAIRGPWRDLADACSHDTPYVLPEFLLPWLRRMGERIECRFLAAWDDERLAALAPMVERRVGRYGIDALVLLGHPDAPPTPPCEILLRPGCDEALSAFFDFWMTRSHWDALDFPVVPAESPILPRLEALASAGGVPFRSSESLQTYFVPLDGTWTSYHASRTKKMRQNLRRGMRHFERQGAVAFQRYPGDFDFAQAHAAMFAILKRSWKDHEAGTSGWNAFLEDLIAELQAGSLLEIAFLTVGGEAIAYLLEVPYKGVRFALHNGYDLQHQLGNPGQLMLAHAIEAAYGRHEPRYDFTGHKDYLHRWTDTKRSYRRLRLSAPSRIARLKLAAYDWIHERRLQAVHEGTDRVKDERKRDAREREEEPNG